MLSEEVIAKITRRGVQEIISHDEFVRMLQEGKPLRLKMGFDPSRPDIHLGHVVGLRKLRQLQQLGHQVILIVGDWTDSRTERASPPLELLCNYVIQHFGAPERCAGMVAQATRSVN